MKPSLAGRTIVIADDHRLFAEGVATLLRDHRAATIILTELGQIEPVLATTTPDLLVLDLAFGRTSAMPLLRELRKRLEQMPILVISASEESVIVERVRDTGAAYLAKSRAGADVVEVVQALLDGSYHPPRVKPRRSSTVTSATIGGIQLSRAQIEVLRQVQLGKTNVEISQQMGRAIKTIEAHLSELYARTGLATRGALMRWAIEHAKRLHIALPEEEEEEEG